MKIVYISNSIIPSRTANSIHVMKMCQAFAKNGHEVILIAPEKKHNYEQEVDDVFEFYNVKKNFDLVKLSQPGWKGGHFIYLFKILLFLKQHNPDLVYGRYIQGCYISAISGFKTIFESHAPIWHGSRLEKYFFNKLLGNAHFLKLVVISSILKDMYIEKGLLSEKQIEVAHDGSDEVIDFNNKITLKGNPQNIKVGYVGHLYPGKGVEIVEQICERVHNDIEFHIIGGFEKDVSFWKEKIKSQNVYFYGFISQNKLTKYINALDICLLPNQKIVRTYSEKKNQTLNISEFTSPLKMFEYMAHKKVIIASNLPVLSEVLNEKNAILVEPDKQEQWLKAIEIAKDIYLRAELSGNAHKDSMQYLWKQRAKTLIHNIIGI